MGRVAELDRMLFSLDRQSYGDFEVIVVDQNQDDRLSPVLSKYRNLSLQHSYCAPGASRARNIGLRAASGTIIGFPDDDCWYPEETLEKVSRWFEIHPQWDGLLGVLRDENNHLTGPKWPIIPCIATAATLWKAGITPVTFLRRRTVEAVGFFDERVGPGASSGYYSGEDLDYLLRSVELGFPLRHEPELTIHHPDFHDLKRIRQKTYSYARGGGLMLRLHDYPMYTFTETFLKSIAGAGLFLLRFDFQRSWLYAVRGAGLCRGYFFGKRDIAAFPSL